MKKILMLFGVLLFMGSSLFGQQIRVTGTVTDGMDGTTLPGVSIQIKGTTLGAVTDVRGRYEINVPGDAVLVFSFIGMVSEEVQVGGRNVIDLRMMPDIASLDEVIVVAYGTAKRGSFTGSASTVTAEKIANRPVANVARAIEGQSAGVQVSAGSGQPGAGQDIRIRGFGSINASNDPLFVVDGVPYALGIDNLNPADIESISVLKDASATALYGNRAANGVIMITTKKGTKDRSQLNVSATRGFSNRAIPEYERLGPDQWVSMAWEALVNQYQYRATNPRTLEDAKLLASGVHPSQGTNVSLFTGTGANATGNLRYNPYNVPGNQVMLPDGTLNPDARLIYSSKDLDWEDAITRMGDRSEISMNYSGGSGKTDYFVSMSYLDDKGYVINSDFERFTARMNVNSQIKDWFRSGVNISANIIEANNARDGSNTGFVNPFFFSRSIGPIYPIYAQYQGTDENAGKYILDLEGKKQFDRGGFFGLPQRPNGAHTGRHVIAETLWNQDRFKRNTMSARTFGEFAFLKDFTFTVNAAIDYNNYAATSYDNHIVGDGAPAGRGEKVNSITAAYTFNQLLKYNKSFGVHSFDVLLGHESYEWIYDYARGFKQGVILPGNPELINFATINASTSYQYKYRTEGYFTGLNYGYADKYFGSASFRRDGSSRFYKDSRWGNFWSLGGAWRMDRESFIQNYNWINILMLRASYGQVGNDNLDSYYPWHSLYSYNNNANYPGFLYSSLPAYDLVWESNNSLSIGLEYGLFGRLRGNVDFFHRISDNLLFSVPQPISSGVLTRDQNIGTMYNQGIELRAAYDILLNTPVKWTIDLNATTFMNKITKMPVETPEIISGTKKLKEGQSIYDFWLRQWWGVDPADGRSLYYADNTALSSNRIVGNDTLTLLPTNAKYAYSGSAIPDLMGGVTNTFKYKNWELSVLTTYQLGGKVYDQSYAALMGYGSWGNAMHKDQLNRWQQPGDITNVPRIMPDEVGNANAVSDRWLIDASYFNIRSVNLSYTLPVSMANRIHTERVRVFATAENLHLFSKREGLNVQQNFTGVTSNVYTPARSITFGFNVSL